MANNTDILKDYLALPSQEKAKVDVNKFNVLKDYHALPDSEKEKVHKSLGATVEKKSPSGTTPTTPLPSKALSESSIIAQPRPTGLDAQNSNIGGAETFKPENATEKEVEGIKSEPTVDKSWTGNIKKTAKEMAAIIPASIKLGIATGIPDALLKADMGTGIDINDIPKEQFEAEKKDLKQKALKEYIEAQAAGAKNDRIKSYTQIQDFKDLGNYLTNNIVESGVQIPAAVASLGVSSYLQETADIYKDAVDKIAEEHKITPEEVVAQGKDDVVMPRLFGALAGSLDFIGGEGTLRALRVPLTNALKKTIIKKGTGVLKEGVTEGAQTALEQTGSSLAAGQEVELHPQEIIEAAIKGITGSAGIVTVSSLPQIASKIKELPGLSKKQKDMAIEAATQEAEAHKETVDDVHGEIKDQENSVNLAEQNQEQTNAASTTNPITPETNESEIRNGQPIQESGSGSQEIRSEEPGSSSSIGGNQEVRSQENGINGAKGQKEEVANATTETTNNNEPVGGVPAPNADTETVAKSGKPREPKSLSETSSKDIIDLPIQDVEKVADKFKKELESGKDIDVNLLSNVLPDKNTETTQEHTSVDGNSEVQNGENVSGDNGQGKSKFKESVISKGFLDKNSISSDPAFYEITSNNKNVQKGIDLIEKEGDDHVYTSIVGRLDNISSLDDKLDYAVAGTALLKGYDNARIAAEKAGNTEEANKYSERIGKLLPALSIQYSKAGQLVQTASLLDMVKSMDQVITSMFDDEVRMNTEKLNISNEDFSSIGSLANTIKEQYKSELENENSSLKKQLDSLKSRLENDIEKKSTTRRASGDKKIKDAFDILDKLAPKFNAVEEGSVTASDAFNAIIKLGDGLIDKGIATIEDVVQKIKEHLQSRYGKFNEVLIDEERINKHYSGELKAEEALVSKVDRILNPKKAKSKKPKTTIQDIVNKYPDLAIKYAKELDAINKDFIKKKANKQIESELNRIAKSKNKNAKTEKPQAFIDKLSDIITNSEESDLTEESKNAYIESKAGASLTKEDRAVIRELTKKAEALPAGSQARAIATQEALVYVASKMPVSSLGIAVSINYSGMLSSPFTLMNSMISAQIDLGNTRANAVLSGGLGLNKVIGEAWKTAQALDLRQTAFALAYSHETPRKNSTVADITNKSYLKYIAQQEYLKGMSLAKIPIGKWYDSVFSMLNATDAYIASKTDFYNMGIMLHNKIERENPSFTNKQVFDEMRKQLNFTNEKTVADATQIVVEDPSFKDLPKYQVNKQIYDNLMKGFKAKDGTKYDGIDNEAISDAIYLTDLGLLKASTKLKNYETNSSIDMVAGSSIRVLNNLNNMVESMYENGGLGKKIGAASLKAALTSFAAFGKTTINSIDRAGDLIPLYSNIKMGNYANKRGYNWTQGALGVSKFQTSLEQVEYNKRKIQSAKGISAFMGLTALSVAMMLPDEEEEKKRGTYFFYTGNGTGMPKNKKSQFLQDYGRNNLVLMIDGQTYKLPAGNSALKYAFELNSITTNLIKYGIPGSEPKEGEIEKTKTKKALEITGYLTASLIQGVFQGSFNLNLLKLSETIESVTAGNTDVEKEFNKSLINLGSTAFNVIPYANGIRALEGLIDNQKTDALLSNLAWRQVPLARALNKAKPAIDFFGRPIRQSPSETNNGIASTIKQGFEYFDSKKMPQKEKLVRDLLYEKGAIPNIFSMKQPTYVVMPKQKDMDGNLNENDHPIVLGMDDEHSYKIKALASLILRKEFTSDGFIDYVKNHDEKECKKVVNKYTTESIRLSKRKIMIEGGYYDRTEAQQENLFGATKKTNEAFRNLANHSEDIDVEFKKWQKENDISFRKE